MKQLITVMGTRSKGAEIRRVPVVAMHIPVERLPEDVQRTLLNRPSWPVTVVCLAATYPYEPDPDDYVLTKEGALVTVWMQPTWWLRVVLGKEPEPEWLALLPSPNEEERAVLQDLILEQT